jgi:hypothetical protein
MRLLTILTSLALSQAGIDSVATRQLNQDIVTQNKLWQRYETSVAIYQIVFADIVNVNALLKDADTLKINTARARASAQRAINDTQEGCLLLPTADQLINLLGSQFVNIEKALYSAKDYQESVFISGYVSKYFDQADTALTTIEQLFQNAQLQLEYAKDLLDPGWRQRGSQAPNDPPPGALPPPKN